MSKNPLGNLNHLSLDKAAGSGIPEIKTILSGAHSVDTLMHRLYFYAMHRLRNPRISRWAYFVYKVIWFGTFSWFGPMPRLAPFRCSRVISPLTCCQARRGLLSTLQVVLAILSVDFIASTKTTKVCLPFVDMGHVNMIILISETA